MRAGDLSLLLLDRDFHPPIFAVRTFNARLAAVRFLSLSRCMLLSEVATSARRGEEG